MWGIGSRPRSCTDRFRSGPSPRATVPGLPRSAHALPWRPLPTHSPDRRVRSSMQSREARPQGAGEPHVEAAGPEHPAYQMEHAFASSAYPPHNRDLVMAIRVVRRTSRVDTGRFRGKVDRRLPPSLVTDVTLLGRFARSLPLLQTRVQTIGSNRC